MHFDFSNPASFCFTSLQSPFSTSSVCKLFKLQVKKLELLQLVQSSEDTTVLMAIFLCQCFYGWYSTAMPNCTLHYSTVHYSAGTSGVSDCYL